MDALTWEALPQRAPRERRRERVEAEAPAAPPSTAKRSREAGDAADGRAHPGSGAGELAEAQLVTVSWREVEDAHQNFEYLDHTADIQLHAWGNTVEEVFGWTALCMFNYMTPMSGFAAEAQDTEHVFNLSEAHDMQSLLFTFLDELLFVFSTEFLVVRTLELHAIDRSNWTMRVVGRGSRFVPGKHEQGTEAQIKAITYSAMQIHEREAASDKPAEIFVIVDI